MNYIDKYNEWMNHSSLDEKTKQDLLKYSQKEIEDAFYCDIEFGTAGMRGVMGPGTNRINNYTILRACLGYSKFLIGHGKNKVAISYDNRNNSREYAELSAKVLAIHGIEVFLFDKLRPTPELSFAVRYCKCDGGIMITASHNSKEYNGYKLYDENGCQNIPSIAQEITKEVQNIDNYLDFNLDVDFDKTKIHIISKEVDDAYYEKVLSIQLREYLTKDIKIAFSPEHGASLVPVRTCLKMAGYNVHEVEKESIQVGDFPNTKSPNPELREAYDGVIEKANKINADLLLVCDPDGDRMGVGIKKNASYYIFNGNQTGAILLDYILRTKKEMGADLSNSIMFNTIVTSDIGEAVARHYGVKCEKTLTGFKFIGDKIKRYEDTDKNYIFGYEESYGSLISPFVRDKDATQACLMLAEACQYYKTQHKDLLDVLNEIFLYEGAYYDTQFSIELKGPTGKEKLSKIMEGLRDKPLDLKGFVLDYYEDYLYLKKYINGTSDVIEDFDSSNVLKYYFSDGCFVAIRPSGTEPKCKIYISTKDSTYGQAVSKSDSIKNQLSRILQ